MASTEMIAVVGRGIGQRDLINTEREEKSESGDWLAVRDKREGKVKVNAQV